MTLENKQIMEKVESLEKEIANFRNKEQTFQNAILSAQRISDEMQEKSRLEAENTLTLAKKESEELQSKIRQEAEVLRERANRDADKLIRNARNDAARLEHEARAQIHELTSEVNRLIDMRDRISDDLKQLLGNYLLKIEEGVPESLKKLKKIPETALERPAEIDEDMGLMDSDEDDDLDDLYEKIELPVDALPFREEDTSEETIGPEELDLADIEPVGLEDEDKEAARFAIQIDENDGHLAQDPDISIPDLDGDMLFSLDDPLDELEPSVRISPEENSN